MTDGELDTFGRAAASGDGAAFATLCAQLSDPVWRYCRALSGDHELAFEAAQETFLRLVPAVRRWRGDGHIRVYTLVLARRAVAEVVRRERRHRERVASGADPDRSVPDAAGLVELGTLVEGLPDGQREAFVLTQLSGLSYEQAADVAGCAVGTIRSRVYRAREALVAAVGAQEESDARP